MMGLIHENNRVNIWKNSTWFLEEKNYFMSSIILVVKIFFGSNLETLFWNILISNFSDIVLLSGLCETISTHVQDVVKHMRVQIVNL